MPIIRGGYGFGSYNLGDYGTEGQTLDGSALASVSSSVTASGLKYKFGSATATSSSSSDCGSVADFASGALVSSTSTNSSSAEAFVLKRSDKFSYGTGAYGKSVFDNADLQTISSATSSFANVSVIKIQSASASLVASSGSSSGAEKIHQGSSEIVSGSGTLATGVFTISADASVTANASVAIAIDRVRFSGATVSSTNVNTALGREKWEPIQYNSITWSEIAA